MGKTSISLKHPPAVMFKKHQPPLAVEVFFGEALLLALGASPVMIEVPMESGLEFFRDGPGNFRSFKNGLK